jgi:hypothetical protein
MGGEKFTGQLLRLSFTLKDMLWQNFAGTESLPTEPPSLMMTIGFSEPFRSGHPNTDLRQSETIFTRS